MRATARRVWIAARAGIERVVPRETLDRLLERVGFFRLKSLLLRSRCRLPDGNEIVYRLDEERVIQEVYRDGAYDAATIADGDTVVDAGANIGVFAVKAARLTPRGRVLAIEPAPLNLELLRENVERNRLAHAKVLPCAVSDHEGQAQLFSRGDYAMYSLRESGDLSTAVRLSTLDRIFADEGVDRCGLLKIDVEGEEVAVLRGAAKALAVTRQVIMEITKVDEYPRRCRELLSAAGFECRVEGETPGGLVLYARRPGA